MKDWGLPAGNFRAGRQVAGDPSLLYSPRRFASGIRRRSESGGQMDQLAGRLGGRGIFSAREP